MGDTIEDMDIETEQKGKKKQFLEKKIRLPDCNVIDETKKLGLNNISSRRKNARNTRRLINVFNIHNYIENKNQTN